MSTVSFELFLPEVLPTVIGCADVTALSAIRNACIEFCEQTSVWQEMQELQTLTADDFPYQILAPSGAKVSNIVAVRVNGQRIPPKTFSELEAFSGDWQALRGEPNVFTQLASDTILPCPMPTEPVDVLVTVVYAPTRAAQVVGETVYQDYVDTIASGAMARLLVIPNQPWSNPVLATYHKSLFESGMAKARLDVFKSFGRATVVIQPRSFGY